MDKHLIITVQSLANVPMHFFVDMYHIITVLGVEIELRGRAFANRSGRCLCVKRKEWKEDEKEIRVCICDSRLMKCLENVIMKKITNTMARSFTDVNGRARSHEQKLGEERRCYVEISANPKLDSRVKPVLARGRETKHKMSAGKEGLVCDCHIVVAGVSRQATIREIWFITARPYRTDGSQGSTGQPRDCHLIKHERETH